MQQINLNQDVKNSYVELYENACEIKDTHAAFYSLRNIYQKTGDSDLIWPMISLCIENHDVNQAHELLTLIDHEVSLQAYICKLYLYILTNETKYAVQTGKLILIKYPEEIDSYVTLSNLYRTLKKNDIESHYLLLVLNMFQDQIAVDGVAKTLDTLSEQALNKIVSSFLELLNICDQNKFKKIVHVISECIKYMHLNNIYNPVVPYLMELDSKLSAYQKYLCHLPAGQKKEYTYRDSIVFYGNEFTQYIPLINELVNRNMSIYVFKFTSYQQHEYNTKINIVDCNQLSSFAVSSFLRKISPKFLFIVNDLVDINIAPLQQNIPKHTVALDAFCTSCRSIFDAVCISHYAKTHDVMNSFSEDVYIFDNFRINPHSLPKIRPKYKSATTINIGTLNSSYKICFDFLDSCALIMLRKEEVNLVLPLYNYEQKVNSQKFFEARGVQSSRIMFVQPEKKFTPYGFPEIDIYLDTVSMGGRESVANALAYSIPVITVEGKSYAKRQASSMLKKINLSECICLNTLCMVELVLDLIENRELLVQIKDIIKTELENNDWFSVYQQANDFIEMVSHIEEGRCEQITNS